MPLQVLSRTLVTPLHPRLLASTLCPSFLATALFAPLQVLSQTLVTLLRNATYLFFMLHFAACTFWYLARLEGFSADSWVGQLVAPEGDAPLVQEPMGVQYAFSLYFTVTTFATVGYGGCIITSQ